MVVSKWWRWGQVSRSHDHGIIIGDIQQEIECSDGLQNKNLDIDKFKAN